MDESQNEQKPVTSRSMIPVVFPPESLNNLLSTSNAIQRLLEQNDQLFNRFSTVKEYFSVLDVSVHTPNEGSDWLESVGVQSAKVFQSTLPMKGVTTAITKPTQSTKFQSTLPMKGVTQTRLSMTVCVNDLRQLV